MKSIKKKLKDEIPNGLDNTFDLIAAIILPNSQYYDDYILQKGKYKQLSKLWHKGTLKLDDYQIEESKIREAVISFINDLEEEDVHSNLIKSNKKEGVITRTNTEFRNLDSFRRALPRTEAIVSNFNALLPKLLFFFAGRAIGCRRFSQQKPHLITFGDQSYL